MLKILVKKQLSEIFRGYFYDAKKNKARSKVSIALYIALFLFVMVGILGGIFTMASIGLCTVLGTTEVSWLYFASMGMLAVLLGTFGSVFSTYSTLYLAKDNDLLISMPIPVGVLMASRLLSVYVMGLLYSSCVLLPAIIVYWVMVSASVKAIFGGVLFLLLNSILVLTLACAFGWIVAKISVRLKNKSIVTVIIYIALMGGYYFVYYKAQGAMGNLAKNLVANGEKIKKAAYPLYLFGQAGTGDPLAILITAVGVGVLFGIMWHLVSSSFLKIATTSVQTSQKAYRKKTVKKQPVNAALLNKELAHFKSSPNYILNCGMGSILLLIAGPALIWKGNMLFSTLERVCGKNVGGVSLLTCTMVCLLAAMNDVSAPSVSLEGKNLWLLQSLPVTPWQILYAKFMTHITVTVLPMVVCYTCVLFVYPDNLGDISTILGIYTVSYVILSSLFGLFLGINMPNINWTNETAPIKQSACVALTLLGNFVYPLIPVAVYFLTGAGNLGFTAYASIWIAITLGLSAVLYFWLKTKGSEKFADL